VDKRQPPERMDVTQSFAATFVDELAAQGVEYACASPGSRSAPLAMALQRHPRIKVLMHIDERSGSFFGVGLAKATGKPVVLLCTSGTAAAEYHAAVVEASYSRTPLIVLTADRPPELREVGANQAIEQARLYGAAVRWFFLWPRLTVERFLAPAGWGRSLIARVLATVLVFHFVCLGWIFFRADSFDTVLVYLGSIGMRPGAQLIVVEKAPLGGPVTVNIEGTPHAISLELARMVTVIEANPALQSA